MSTIDGGEHFDVIACESEEQWLAARQSGLGASESAALFGVNPWDSPYSLWAQKTGVLPRDKIESEPMEWGVRLEPLIANKYHEVTGQKLVDLGRHTILRSKKLPILFATLDRVIESSEGEEGPGVLEIKAVGAHRKDEWDEGPSLVYQVQLQQQLAVTGYSWGVIAVLFGGQEFGWIKQPRNQAFLDALYKKTINFWALVESRTPPPVDADKRTEEALKLLHPRDNGLTVELPPDADEWDAELEAVKSQMKALESRERELKNNLLAAIGDASFAKLTSGVSYSLKTQTRKSHEVKESTFRALRRIASKEKL